MSKVAVRAAKREEFAQWQQLWDGYMRFYKQEPDARLTAMTWERFFDAYEPMHALVAELDGQIVGIVHYIFHRSTWMFGPNCYLQDLFTADGMRGKGVGRALIEAVYSRAKAAGATRVYWTTHETNTTAMTLYDKVATKSGFQQYRKELA